MVFRIYLFKVGERGGEVAPGWFGDAGSARGTNAPGHSGPTPATRILLTPRINTNKKPISRAYHDCRAYYPPEFIHFYGKTERD